MKMKKALSIILCILMLISAVPIVFAVTPVALTESNVTVWPTANGSIYFGQKISDGVTLSGGEVQYNGVIVPGHFDFIDSGYMPTSSGTQFASLKFVPDDLNAYLGFNIDTAWDVTYTVNKTIPVFVDENETIPVATEVEPGAKLSTSKLSGAKVRNPYYEDEPKALAGVWKWAKSSTIVNESGYYEARITISGYERLTAQVYVKVASDIPETAIAENPTLPELTYNPNVTWGSLSLEGGKAVIKGTTTEVSGTFSLKDRWLNAVPNPNITEVDVVFTPDDPEEALPYEFTIPVTVNPLPISFKGNDGNYIVDGFVFEVSPGTKMSDVESMLKSKLNAPKNSVLTVEDYYGNAEHGRTYKLIVSHDDSYYTGKEIYFTIAFKEVQVAPTITIVGLNKFRVNCGNYSPAGKFTVTLNGEEVATVRAGEVFECVTDTDEGGTFEIVAKYNPTENDYFIVSDAIYSTTVNPKRNLTTGSGMAFTVNGSKTYNAIRTGDVIELEFTMPDFALFVIKDGSGKTVTLDGVDLTSRKITFTMPDHDLKISVKTNAQLEREEAAANCDHICHSKNTLLQMLWKLIKLFCQLFDIQQYCDCGLTHYDAPLFG